MKNNTLTGNKATVVITLVCITIVWLFGSAGGHGNAQTQPPPVNLPAGLDDIVKLTRAGIGEDIILSKIRNDGASYNLTADQIIYLSNQGVSQNVLSALLQGKSAGSPTFQGSAGTQNPVPQISSAAEPPPLDSANPAANDQPAGAPAAIAAPAPVPAAPAPQPAPAEVSLDYFRGQLAPYGNWVDVPGYGLCWRPSIAPGWRPYYDGGHWVYTDSGWYWQSDYPWGDIAFHYGRWSYTPAYGWLWSPGYEFAPAWVFWRQTEGYCGWAPLPFGALFVGGAWEFHGARVGIDFNFGLTAGFFTFVAYDHFWEHDFRRFVVPRERVTVIYRNSTVINNYRVVNNRIVNEGLGRDRIARFTGKEVNVVEARGLRAREEQTHLQLRQVDRETLKRGGKVEATRRVELMSEPVRSNQPGERKEGRGLTDREQVGRGEAGRSPGTTAPQPPTGLAKPQGDRTSSPFPGSRSPSLPGKAGEATGSGPGRQMDDREQMGRGEKGRSQGMAAPQPPSGLARPQGERSSGAFPASRPPGPPGKVSDGSGSGPGRQMGPAGNQYPTDKSQRNNDQKNKQNDKP